MSFDLPAVLALCLGYLLGSLPFGVVLTRLAGLGDVRAIGSGNIGATNVLRTGNKALAFITVLLDGGKGAAAYGLALLFAPEAAILAGAAAFLGHLYPVYIGFKGGKGVATFLGLMLAAAWPVGLACAAIWLLVALTLRISSLAALVSAAASPVLAWFLAPQEVVILAGALAIAIFIKHETNIRRLLRGEEPKIGERG